MKIKAHAYLFLLACITAGCGPEVINSSALVDERGAPFESMSSTDYAYYQGQLFSGVAEITKNEIIRSRVEFKDGRKHGLEQWWFENGKLSRSFNYKNGELHGLREAWYEDGQPSRKAMYENGQYHGLFESWHENGQMSERSFYKEGERDGLTVSWDFDGELRDSVMYENGVTF